MGVADSRFPPNLQTKETLRVWVYSTTAASQTQVCAKGP